MSPVITTCNLTKKFGTLTALAQVDLTVAPGTVFGFLGPNGAGKTTAVRLLNGLLLPTAGQAFVLGHEVPRDSQRVRQRCGVQTDTNLYEKLTVQENLEIWGGLYGLRGSDLQQRCLALDSSLQKTGRNCAAAGRRCCRCSSCPWCSWCCCRRC